MQYAASKRTATFEPASGTMQALPSAAKRGLWADERPATAGAEAVLRERLHARLADLLAEYDDTALAIAESQREHELGLPAPMLSVLQARLDRDLAEMALLQAHLAYVS